MEVSKIIQKEGIASEDGSCCLHGQHSLSSLLFPLPLLQPNSEQAMEIAVTAIFLFTVVDLLQDTAFELQEILSVVLEPITG